MIKSIKGPKGGYQLSCDINSINIFEFIEMLEGPVGLVDCMISHNCNQLEYCTIKDPLMKINSKIIKTLKSYRFSMKNANIFLNKEVLSRYRLF